MGNIGSNYEPISNETELTPHEMAMKIKYEKAQEEISSSEYALFIRYFSRGDLYVAYCDFSLPFISKDFQRKSGVDYKRGIILGFYETIAEAEVAVQKRLRDIYGKIENEHLVKHPIYGEVL